MAATVTGIFYLMYWQVTSANLTQIRQLLEDESATAVDNPTDEIKQQLALRLTRDLRRLDFVGLFDAGGRLVYGNFAGPIPVAVDGHAHLVSVPLPDGAGASEAAVFIARPRADGGVLMLGRSLVGVYRLRMAMHDAYVSAVIPVVVLAIAGGILVSLRESKRLHAIQLAIARVMSGELDARLPVDGRQDDVGNVTRAVNRMLDEIDRLVTQLRSVGDNIAHDLRTPLAAMRAQLERGLASPQEETVRAVARQALESLDRALKTVHALLRIAELESGVRRSAFAAVDLVATCRDVLDLFSPLATAKRITLTLQAPASAIIHGDEALIQEIVINLLDNAVKFTPSGGVIKMQAGPGPVIFRISDTGPGVPHDERENIFKRFYRMPSASRTPGSGLGLSLATTIANMHGFSLRMCEGDAPGATFEIVAGETRTLSDELCGSASR